MQHVPEHTVDSLKFLHTSFSEESRQAFDITTITVTNVYRQPLILNGKEQKDGPYDSIYDSTCKHLAELVERRIVKQIKRGSSVKYSLRVNYR